MTRMRTLTALLLIAGMSAGALLAEDPTEPPYVPYDVRDAVIALGELLGPEWDKLSAEERQMASRPMLMQIRNLWIHGSGKSPRLKNYFLRKGIYNTDLMSSVIWEAYQATITQTRFDLRVRLTEMASYPSSINLFTPDEAHPTPKEVENLWQAYLVQKDDQTAIRVFCDETGTPTYTYDPDAGWEPASKHILEVVRTKRAIRLKMGPEDDQEMPLSKAIRLIKSRIEKEGGSR
jgi:hypothetical protein